MGNVLRRLDVVLVVISEDLESCDLSDSKTQHGRRGTRPPKSIKFLLEKFTFLLEITFFGTYTACSAGAKRSYTVGE